MYIEACRGGYHPPAVYAAACGYSLCRGRHIQTNRETFTKYKGKVSDLINLDPGEFYGIIAEGKPKEFLKTQFLEDFAENEANKNTVVTDQEMNDNYFRIIEEAKALLK